MKFEDLDKVLVFHDYYTRGEDGKKVLHKPGKQRTVVVGWAGDIRYVSITKCSKEDNYCKKKGRAICISRLKSHLKGKKVNNVKQYNSVHNQFVSDLPDWLFKEKDDIVPF